MRIEKVEPLEISLCIQEEPPNLDIAEDTFLRDYVLVCSSFIYALN